MEQGSQSEVFPQELAGFLIHEIPLVAQRELYDRSNKLGLEITPIPLGSVHISTTIIVDIREDKTNALCL